MKPESQKIGKPVIKPVIARATGLLFSPVFDSMYFAILIVPPVLSRVIPIIAPRIIRNPMEAIVFPKPSFNVDTMTFPGKVVKARNRDTRKSAINAFNLSFEVNKIIAIILIPTSDDFNNISMNLV